MIVFAALPGREALREEGRPSAPAIPEATDAHRRMGGRLRLIHDAHRQELRDLRALLDRIEADEAPADATPAAVAGMGMSRNLALFGALCGRECQHLQFHHDIEEGHTFPIVEHRGGDGVRAVIAKLREEHEVVHALIAALAERSTALARDRSQLPAVRETLDRIEEVVRSHFAYEEGELEEALGVYNAL